MRKTLFELGAYAIIGLMIFAGAAFFRYVAQAEDFAEDCAARGGHVLPPMSDPLCVDATGAVIGVKR